MRAAIRARSAQPAQERVTRCRRSDADADIDHLDVVGPSRGIGIRQGRQTGDVISQHLGGNAAEAEHHQRPEDRFLHYSDQGLDAACKHWLQQHALQVIAEPAGELLVASGNIAGPAQN